MSNILITGAAGFIGSQLCHELWLEHHNLTLVDDFSYGFEDNLIFEDVDFRSQIIKMDITDFSRLCDLIKSKKIDYIYHIAGIAPLPDCQSNPYRAMEVNIGGTINVLESARLAGVKNVIFASTSAIYENETEFPNSEDYKNKPSLIYPSTKYCAEQFCKSYHDTYGLNVSIMRFANVYGPHIDCLRKQPPFVAYVIRELYYGNVPVLHSDGRQSRDYIYISDLIDIAKILLNNQGFDIINVSSNHSYSVSEIYDIIAKIMNIKYLAEYTKSENYWKKYPELYSGAYPIKPSILDHEVNKHTCCDNKHAYEKYGWAPKISMEEGLKQTVDCVCDLLKKHKL